MAKKDLQESGSSGSDGGRSLPEGPATGPLKPIRIGTFGAGEKADRAQKRLNRGLRREPSAIVRFIIVWWAVMSGRRVSGLAAEAAFWVMFSLPWLFLAMVSSLGHVSDLVGADVLQKVKTLVEDGVARVLTPDAASTFATPVLNTIFQEGRDDLPVIGLVFALWAGSRAVMTYVEAVSIINGEFGSRGYFRRRGLSMLLYFVAALLSLFVWPVILFGPETVGELTDLPSNAVAAFTLILVLVVMMILITTLFHVAAFERRTWRSAVPGALLALVIGSATTLVLAYYVQQLFNENSVYAILAAPIALMVFAYALSLIVLGGAAFNAVREHRPVFAPDTDRRGRFARADRALHGPQTEAEEEDEIAAPNHPT